jgi:hypothetical protein
MEIDFICRVHYETLYKYESATLISNLYRNRWPFVTVFNASYDYFIAYAYFHQ